MIGRFLTKDTFKGETQDTSTLNRYAYAGGDPVSFVDPSGNRHVRTATNGRDQHEDQVLGDMPQQKALEGADNTNRIMLQAAATAADLKIERLAKDISKSRIAKASVSLGLFGALQLGLGIYGDCQQYSGKNLQKAIALTVIGAGLSIYLGGALFAALPLGTAIIGTFVISQAIDMISNRVKNEWLDE